MAITISNGRSVPSQFPDGTTNANVSFDGMASADGTRVKITVSVSPSSELSIPVPPPGDFTFSHTVQTFTIPCAIANNAGGGPGWKKGSIDIKATAVGTPDSSSVSIAIDYN